MGQLSIVEMVAYQAEHSSDDLPWRCVVCEKLTPHDNESIEEHLLRAHNLSLEHLRRDDGAIYWDTPLPAPEEIQPEKFN